MEGRLFEDMDGLLPKKYVRDDTANKPADWVDEPDMDDPTDFKPADWVDEPYITDQEAIKPSDWNGILLRWRKLMRMRVDEDDGPWEAPLVSNPEYKGRWKPRKIPNPAYKGPWERPEIINRLWNEKVERETAAYRVGAVGIEIWQVKAGSIFDDILLTNSEEEAARVAKKTFFTVVEKERAAHRALRDAEIEELRKKEEAAEAGHRDEL